MTPPRPCSRHFLQGVKKLRVELGREQRRALIAESLRSDPELSNREHARRTGANHETVGRVRTSLESTGEIRQSDARVSGDGRVRPASQPPRETEAIPDFSGDPLKLVPASKLSGYDY